MSNYVYRVNENHNYVWEVATLSWVVMTQPSGGAGGGGDASAANQLLGNASLASIDGKLGSLGQKAMAGSAPIVIASDQSAVPVADGGGSLTVDGTVAASNFPATADTNSGVKSASTLRVVLATDQPALTNKLLVTPDSVALPANQSVNAAQLAGTTTDTNSGAKSAGTLRVVLATDQPQLTAKLLVTPDSVALPANQSVNQTQWGGTAVDVNSGTKSAGTVRVVIATDQPALTNKLLVTPDSVALPANQSVNAAQINGVTPLMGAGSTGTGALRTTESGSPTGTQSSVAGTVTADTTILASNAARMGAAVYNDSTAVLTLLVGAGTQSATVFTLKIAAGGYYEVPFKFTGRLAGNWASATGSARVTEYS